MHYQWMWLSNVNFSVSSNVISSNIKSYYKYYTIYENNKVQ